MWLLLMSVALCDSFDLDADQQPVTIPTLAIPLSAITTVTWPVRPDHLDKRTRICCFSISTKEKEHIFAAPNKSW